MAFPTVLTLGSLLGDFRSSGVSVALLRRGSRGRAQGAALRMNSRCAASKAMRA
jgi:hypothetical protein